MHIKIHYNETGKGGRITKGDIRYGDVFLADLPMFGHVQGGVRPAIIVQNEVGNTFSPTTHVVPLTSKVLKGNHLPTHVVIAAEPENGLSLTSVAQAEGTQAIDKKSLLQKLGRINHQQMSKIKNALKVQFQLNG